MVEIELIHRHTGYLDLEKTIEAIGAMLIRSCILL